MQEKDLVFGIESYMSQLYAEKRYSTRKSYRDALRSFQRFSGKEKIPYTYINKEQLLRYQQWLLEQGCSFNTVSTYMRRIRHVHNLAVESGDAPYIPNLFKDVFTGVESPRKKALPLESLRALMQTEVEDPVDKKNQMAVNLMFVFCGMAFVDLVHLKKESIRDGILSYHRQKSGSLIQIEIPEEVIPLLECLSGYTDADSPYLFPFLSGTKTGEAAYKEYVSVLGHFNQKLKSLAAFCGVTTSLSSYTIRHSFAMTLKEQDVPIEVISELLGHKSIKTTQIYLKNFSLERLSAVNRACFEKVYKPESRVDYRYAT